MSKFCSNTRPRTLNGVLGLGSTADFMATEFLAYLRDPINIYHPDAERLSGRELAAPSKSGDPGLTGYILFNLAIYQSIDYCQPLGHVIAGGD